MNSLDTCYLYLIIVYEAYLIIVYEGFHILTVIYVCTSFSLSSQNIFDHVKMNTT